VIIHGYTEERIVKNTNVSKELRFQTNATTKEHRSDHQLHSSVGFERQPSVASSLENEYVVFSFLEAATEGCMLSAAALGTCCFEPRYEVPLVVFRRFFDIKFDLQFFTSDVINQQPSERSRMNVNEMDLRLTNDATNGVASEDEKMSHTSQLFDVLDERELGSTLLNIPSDSETVISTDGLLDFDDDLNLFEPIKLEELFDLDDASTLAMDVPDETTELLREQTRPTQPPPNPPPQNPDFNCLENLPYEIVERPRYSVSILTSSTWVQEHLQSMLENITLSLELDIPVVINLRNWHNKNMTGRSFVPGSLGPQSHYFSISKFNLI